MLLSDRDIKAELASGRVRIDPFELEMVQPSSVDVRLDRYFRVFENHKYPHIDPAVEQADLTRLVDVEPDEAFVLHPGEFVLASTYEVFGLPDDLAARLEGKALAIDTMIPTPTGWRTMGELQVGDQVFDENGRPTAVLATTEAMYGRECRRVTFCTGESLVADLDHQWITRTPGEPVPSVRTTRDIERALSDGQEHRVPLTDPVAYPERELPDDPYRLGVRLASGRPLRAEIMAGAGAPRTVRESAAMPESHLCSSVEQRRAMLRGLLDTGGRRAADGGREFVTLNENVAIAVAELAASLGLRPTRTRVTLDGERLGLGHLVQLGEAEAGQDGSRTITRVDAVPTRPVRCIQVANRNGVYLAGRGYIPTHNSSLGRLGLLTHSTAGWIDPGFTGHVTLELSNVATLPIKLWPGMKIGQMCLFRTTTPTEFPYGSAKYGSRYQGQRGPTPSRSYLNFHRTKI